MKLDTFTRSYMETALWSTNDESDESGGEPLDKNYSVNDLAPEAVEKMVKDCKAFQESHWDLISHNLEGAGHDFWLTRNHHGAGFWDGDWMHGQVLTEACRVYGEVYLYVGDDGHIYSN